MTKPSLEWDFDNPKHRQRRRRPPPPLEGEILTPDPEPTIVRVEVHHHHKGVLPQRLVTVAAMLILAMILLRSPFGLLMLAVLVPPTFWIAVGATIAALIIIAIHERWRGRPF